MKFTTAACVTLDLTWVFWGALDPEAVSCNTVLQCNSTPQGSTKHYLSHEPLQGEELSVKGCSVNWRPVRFHISMWREMHWKEPFEGENTPELSDTTHHSSKGWRKTQCRPAGSLCVQQTWLIVLLFFSFPEPDCWVEQTVFGLVLWADLSQLMSLPPCRKRGLLNATN